MAVPVPKLKFSEPRHNLPGRKGVATLEDRFTISFARAYAEQLGRIHSGSRRMEMVMAREIPVNGYGIADLMAVSWEPGCTENQGSVENFVWGKPATTRAFELKMRDWRSALRQANRYRFFAHQAIVVMPGDACEHAQNFLDTFKKLRVGLWRFDRGTPGIEVIHTPRPRVPKCRGHCIQAVGLVHRATRQALPIEGKG